MKSRLVFTVLLVVMLVSSLATPLAVAQQDGPNPDAPQSLTELIASGLPAPAVQPVAPNVPPVAPEALTFYDNRGVFDADYPGLPIEGYENGSMAPGTIDAIPHPLDEFSSNTYFDPGDILPGIQFWGTADQFDDEIAVLGQGFAGNPSKTAVANYFTDAYRIVFDPPVQAAGMDLQEFVGSYSCQVDIYDALGSLLASVTSACNEAGVFWGVASDADPIGAIVITSLGGGAEGADNIAFGSVAEPSFDAWKEAPPEAQRDEVISYTITIEGDGLAGAFMMDPLPAGVEYAGNLTWNVGEAWYDDVENTVYWEYGSGLLYGAANLLSSGYGPSNLYTIDPETGDATLIGPIGFDNVTGLAFLADGRMVGSARGDALYGGTVTAILIEIDPATGAGTLIGVISDVNIGCGRMPDITFDRATGTLYGYGDYCGGAPEGLFTIDPDTGVGTSVGPSGYSGGGNGMAIEPATGIIYATPFDNQSLITIDPVTGQGTEVPGSAGNVPYRVNALAFDPLTGAMFGSWNDTDPYKLVVISTFDGDTTVVGNTVLGLDALVFAESGAPAAFRAPAVPQPTVYDPAAVADLVGGVAPEQSVPAGPVALWSYPEAVLWDNGPQVTHPGGGYNGHDASALQSALGLNTYGFGNQFVNGYRMADDFEIIDPAGWHIDTVTFFAYQTATYPYPPPSTITGIYVQIWDGPPNDPGSSVVWGDLTTNRMLETYWSEIYRVLDTALTNTQRPTMASVAGVDYWLPPGTYWFDWLTDGSGASGPWAPPISILGETTTGNAMQYTTAWAVAVDTGLGTPQGMPFVIEGTVPGGQQAIITFDVTVTAYGGQTIVNEGWAGLGDFVVYFSAQTEVVGTPVIVVEPLEIEVELCPAAMEVVELAICNDGDALLEWAIEMAPVDWLSVDPAAGTVVPGECQVVEVTFDAAGMEPDDYLADLLILSNDPETPEVTVPVMMTVLEPVAGADFEWAPEVGIVGEAIEFTASVEAGTLPFAYSWDFGDGTTGTGEIVTHAYGAVGVYTVTLWVENVCAVAMAEHAVTVEEGIMHIFLPVLLKNF